jgi:endonuclease/exonuclease/phosphatase family metal-dependent hydrolase
MCEDQFRDLSCACPDYQPYAVVDEPCGNHPMNCIFYRRAAYTCVSAGGYWLSQTPHVAGSRSWDSANIRLANWIRLQDRESKASFRVVNTHLDHEGQTARENQARVIVEDTHAYPPDYAQVLTGDMNCDSRNRAIQIFKAAGWIDTYGAVHGTEDPGPTFHEFLGPASSYPVGKMDWIFAKGQVKIRDAEVICDSSGGRFPSDHYFVSATLDAECDAEGKTHGKAGR